MPEPHGLNLAFDTCSEMAGVALAQDGSLLTETTWRTYQQHSRELLPALEWLLSRSGRSKSDIGAIFVCTGPGSYAGLRVGISTAKALAYALEVPLAGINRLEADAEPLTATTLHRVVAIQAAGRAELAWGAYRRDESARMQALIEPQIGKLDSLLSLLEKEDIVCAEQHTLNDEARQALASAATLVEAPSQRVGAIARLGRLRLAAGSIDDPDSLVPLYLRAPAIGPQS